MDVWNPLLETLHQQRLRELQELKLKRILRFAYDRSPFYRHKFEAAGLLTGDLDCLTDLARIPITRKSEWQAAQGQEAEGFGSTLALPETEVVRYHETSGTTGEPIRLAFSQRDWNMWLSCWGYGLVAAGLTSLDRVLVCFPFNLFVGWWGGLDAARLVGARVYSGGGMSSMERLDLIRRHRITTLMGAPSYLLRLARIAEVEKKWRVRDFEVEKLICGAEPGASIPAIRRRLEESWGAEVFDHLGASEVGPWGYECSAHPGGVHVCEAFFLLEYLDPETMEPVPPGDLSRVVITALEKYAQPVIRWDLKDLVRLSPSPCPCGRSWGWVAGGVLGRADDLIKVRGVLLSPAAVEGIVSSFEEILDYRVVVSRVREMDELTVRVETRLTEEEWDSLQGELAETLKLKTRLRVCVERVPGGTFAAESDIKIKRVVDRRNE